MFNKFSPFDIPVEPDVTIHGVHGGSGSALLLLHGFPQTHHIWHRVADELAKSYYVVAIDLRGYGRSSKPDGGEGHVRYGKKAMAKDAVVVMNELLQRRGDGEDSFYVCAHDRGARVTHRLCVDYPHLVKRRSYSTSVQRSPCIHRQRKHLRRLISTGSSSSSSRPYPRSRSRPMLRYG